MLEAETLMMFRSLALPIALALFLMSAATAHAAEFVSKRGIPDAVVKSNLERLLNYVASGELKPKQKLVTVTRILGKEDLGFSKVRVWYCARQNQQGQQRDACADGVRLIRLDSGLWIIRDDKSSNWMVVQQ